MPAMNSRRRILDVIDSTPLLLPANATNMPIEEVWKDGPIAMISAPCGVQAQHRGHCHAP
jgi:hypothetical protein